MNCKVCGNSVWLKFHTMGRYIGRFTWRCSNYPDCKTETLYEPPTNRFDFANKDFTPILDTFEQISLDEKIQIETEIKAQMVEILKHFLSCTWGAHYNTLFDGIIMNYLDNPYLLDYVLKSGAVRDVGMVGITGAKIYPELMTYLRRVKSEKIQKYLDTEFINLK